MTANLAQLIEQAQQLSPEQKLTLIAAIAGNRGDEAKLPVDSKRFWQGRSLSEQLAEHPVEPVVSLEQLKSNAWPEDESIEDFLKFTRAQRREALAGEQP